MAVAAVERGGGAAVAAAAAGVDVRGNPNWPRSGRPANGPDGKASWQSGMRRPG